VVLSWDLGLDDFLLVNPVELLKNEENVIYETWIICMLNQLLHLMQADFDQISKLMSTCN